MTALMMLDLSADFDVNRSPNSTEAFRTFLWKQGKALSRVKSYLVHITQCVSVAHKTSPDVSLLFGVQEGSV